MTPLDYSTPKIGGR